MAWEPRESPPISVRADALAGSSPFSRTAAAKSGASVPAVVTASAPSIQISTPGGSVTRNALAEVRVSVGQAVNPGDVMVVLE